MTTFSVSRAKPFSGAETRIVEAVCDIILYRLVEEEMTMDEPPDRSCCMGVRLRLGIQVSTMFRQTLILWLRSLADTT